MILRLVLALALCLTGARSDAWLIQKPASGYVGPGDIAAYTAWHGLRAYSFAVATPGTQPAVRVTRRSDNATLDVVVLSDGSLDTATAAAFTSTDTTGTGAIAGTALTFTGGTVNDVVTGGGTLPGTFIVSGSSPAWTVNKSQTVASATLTLTLPLFVSIIYDQTNGGACTGSCDLVPTSLNRQPVLLLTGCGENADKPCLHGRLDTASNVSGPTAGNFTPNVAAKFSISTFANRTIGTTNTQLNTTNGVNRISIASTADWTLVGTSGGCTTGAANEVWHAANGVVDGAGSVFNIDGTETTCTLTGDLTAAPASFQLALAGSLVTFGNTEMGWADNSAWNAGTRTALCSNQRAYWGSTGSC